MNGEIISIDTVRKIKKLEKENKKLKKDILGLNILATELHSEICLRQQEVNRLNNIINELEKYIKEKINYRRKEMIDFEKDIQFSNFEEQQTNKEEMVIRNFEIIELQDTLDKLQELKGEDK